MLRSLSLYVKGTSAGRPLSLSLVDTVAQGELQFFVPGPFLDFRGGLRSGRGRL